MWKITAVIVITLLAVIGAGVWAIFAVEKERSNIDTRQLEAQRQAASESEAYSAWRHATKYETFSQPITGLEPKPDETFTQRSIWVKSFQKGDIKFAGKSKEYGNDAYTVSTVVAYHDRGTMALLEFMMRKHSPDAEQNVALVGYWRALTMLCKVERLDSGEWIASDFNFSPIASKPEFPFERVHGQ